ncbi:MAG TPA: condensation domain-containing protein, partial [Steroidobacteraceae bacterium]|nr:condensation domain-containing protein [Steroidobacteraceae bacterium]
LVASGGSCVDIAVLNSSRNVVVSGPQTDIDALKGELAALSIACALLPVQQALHSRALDAASAAFRNAVQGVRSTTPTIPVVSCLDPLTPAAVQCTPDYWARQMRETVNFPAGVNFLHQQGVTAFLEVSPASTLAKLGRICSERKGQWLWSAEPGTDPLRTLLASVAKLHEIGVDIDWNAVRDDATPRRACLPTYPFERTRHWILPEDALWDAGRSRAAASPMPVIAAPESRHATTLEDVGLLSTMERHVAAIWNELLSVDAIARDADFFELGGDSLMIVQMHEKIRAQMDIAPPLNTLMENPTLAQFAAALEHLAAKTSKREVAQLLPDPAHRYEPFPLVEIQQAYAVGRTASFDFGGHSTHLYFEVKPRHYDRERFSAALNKLIARHDMLRAVVSGDNQQRILPDIGRYEVRYYDFTGDASGAARHLEALRTEMSHQVLPADRWPLYDIRATRMSDAEVILHFSLDMLMLDATSNRIFFRDLELFYQGKDELLPPLTVSYRDYVMARVAAKSSDEYARAKHYWTSRIQDLPLAPDLPVLNDGATRGPAGFRRRQKIFDRRTTSRLKQRAKGMSVTPSVLFLTAYGNVLAAWSHRSSFTIDISISDRVAMHGNVNDMLGEFTMIELLAMDFSESCSFKERARRIQRQLWSDYEHKEFNGVEVLRELSKFYGGDRQALMPVVFTSVLPVEDSKEAVGLTNQVFEFDADMYSISQTPQVWIDHFAAEEDGQYMLSWDCLEGMFPDGMLDEMFNAYIALVMQLADEDEAWDSPLLNLLPTTLSTVRELTNHRQDTPLDGETLTSLFAARAAAQPGATALTQAGNTLTYGELQATSLLWAARLQEQGVRPGDLVAIVMRAGWEQVVATLAVHNAGAACVPIAAATPPESRSEMLRQLAPRCIMTQHDAMSVGNEAGTPVLVVSKVAASGTTYLPVSVDPQALAYVIHSYDPSREQKAVALTHQALVNTIVAVNERISMRESDRVIAASSLNSGSHVYEIFGPLVAGAAIVIAEDQVLTSPGKLDALIATESVTVLHAASAFASRWIDALAADDKSVAKSVRAVVMSGHRISMDLPARIRARTAHEIELMCLRGSGEAAIWSGCFVVDNVNSLWSRIPYGKPLKNQTLHVLRADLTPSPNGVQGELCIGGASLARGYWNDEEGTRQRFVVHPQSGERLFRTGIAARYIEEGAIELLDREAERIAVNGFAVDRSVIERMLTESGQLSDAFVASQPNAGGGKQLVAYLVRKAGGASMKSPSTISERLRRIVAARLPAFMQPQHYVVLDALPLNEHGDVDTAALPLPKIARPTTVQRRSASSDVERCVVGILEDLLQAKNIGLQDTFFVLGGHSLVAAQFVTRVAEALGAVISIRTVFDNPVIEHLARVVGESRNHANRLPPLPAVSDSEDPVLSFAQQRLWFVHQLQHGSTGYAAAYNLPIIWRIRGDLDQARLRLALQRLLERHDVLRTSITSIRGKPKAIVHPQVELPWTFEDLDGLADAEKVYGAGVERILNTEFDLARAPLMTASLFRWRAGEHSLVLNLHHIVSDLWSEGLIWREIGELYEEVEQPLPNRVPAVQ